MVAKSADLHTVGEIRRLAVDPTRVQVTKGTEWDLLAHHLTKEDICDEIIDWIDADERVKPTTIHSDRYPNLKGQEAYEMKPRIGGTLFYIKVALVELGQLDEYMLVISAHPSH